MTRATTELVAQRLERGGFERRRGPEAGGDGGGRGGEAGAAGVVLFEIGRAETEKKARGRRKPRVLGPGRLYNKLVKAGIGADHWQMHATREVLVNRLLSEREAEGFRPRPLARARQLRGAARAEPPALHTARHARGGGVQE